MSTLAKGNTLPLALRLIAMSLISALTVVTEIGGPLGVGVGVEAPATLGAALCVEACVDAFVAALGGAFSIDFLSPQPGNPRQITATLKANE